VHQQGSRGPAACAGLGLAQGQAGPVPAGPAAATECSQVVGDDVAEADPGRTERGIQMLLRRLDPGLRTLDGASGDGGATRNWWVQTVAPCSRSSRSGG
jgi:hypothetical protein